MKKHSTTTGTTVTATDDEEVMASKKRYRFEIDFESDAEWAVGVLPALGYGRSISPTELAEALRSLAVQVETHTGMPDMPVGY